MTIFSKIINDIIPSFKVAEDDMFVAFLDVAPLQKGHTIVVPRVEIDNLFDVPDDYLSKILLFAKPIAKAIETTYNCKRVAIVVVGFEVPHAHIHLIPINTTQDMNFNNTRLSFTPQDFLLTQDSIIGNIL
jgi:histidine triad (HIT) family protein